MTDSSPRNGGNVSVTSPIGGALAPALTSTHPYETVGQPGENESETIPNTTFYETIPSSSDDRNIGHFGDPDIDACGYVLPNARTNLKENVTLLHGEEELDGDGYLDPNACQ